MKLYRSFVLAVVSFGVAVAMAVEPAKQLPNPFPHLRTVVVEKSSTQTNRQVSYDPALSQLLNGACDFEYNTQGIAGIDVSQVINTRIDRTSPTRYVICFDPGASDDPAYIVVDAKTYKPLGVIDTDHLLLPGNGFIYAIGRTNKLHTERRKFAVRDSKVVEFKQPFLYVGLESHANRALALTSSKESTDIVASIPKGERLTVLISDGDWLLIKTNFGLVGWLQTSSDREALEVEGIYFDGD